MPPKKGKKAAAQKKKVEEEKPKETKRTSASKPRGSSRNSVDKIQTPNPPKQEEITAYLKDENNGKKDNKGRGNVEDEGQQQLEIFTSPKKDTQQIGQLLFTQKSVQSKINTPQAKIVSQSGKVEPKTLFTPSKMQKKNLKISLSGFSKQTKEFNKKAIEELGEYCENIQPDLDVLVAFKSFSAKTKFCSDMGIPVVNSQWLTDSIKERQFIEDFKKYQIKPFEGCTLNILGFSEDDYQAIKESVLSNGGDCINDLNEAQKSAKQNYIDMTILNSKSNQSSYLNIIKTPATDEKWLSECLNRQLFVYPKHYVINKIDLNQYNLEKDEVIKKRMQEVECSSKDYNYFQDCTFYIHISSLDEKKFKVITNLISLGGGFYVNQILPCTTHIVTPHYTKSDFSEFTQYGNSLFLVHPEWLQESFCVCKKLNEVDYQPQLIDQSQIFSQQNNSQDKTKNESNGFTSQQQQLIQAIAGIAKNRNSMNNNIFSNGLYRQSSMNGNNPFSGMNQSEIGLANIPERDENTGKGEQKAKKLTFKQQKSLATVKGNLFKNCYFYLEMSQYKDKLKSYKEKIFENQGEIIPVIDEKVREIFHILDDRPENVKIVAKKLPNVQFYSYRWIDFCIEKKQVIRNVYDQQLFHLTHFNHVMPLKNFIGLSIYSSGYNPNEKLAFKETVKIIGAQYEFTSEKTCYLITDNQECQKLRYLQQEKEELSKEEFQRKWGNLHIVDACWFLECVTQGKLIETDAI